MNTSKSIVTNILKEISSKKKYGFNLLPGEQDTGYIKIGNKRFFFAYGTLNVNNEASSFIAGNKKLSSVLLQDAKIPTPKELTPSEINDVAGIFSEKGTRFIIKPVTGTGGNNLFKVSNPLEFKKIVNLFTEKKIDFVVQEYIESREYRVVLFKGEILQFYERIQSSIAGDGRRSIKDLITDKQTEFESKNRNTQLNINDSQVQFILERENLALTSVAGEKVRIPLSFGKNLSKGGTSIFVENQNKVLDEILRYVTSATGLDLVGLDLFISKELDQVSSVNDLTVIEYNSSPDMENNFEITSEYLLALENIYTLILERF